MRSSLRTEHVILEEWRYLHRVRSALRAAGRRTGTGNILARQGAPLRPGYSLQSTFLR